MGNLSSISSWQFGNGWINNAKLLVSTTSVISAQVNFTLKLFYKNENHFQSNLKIKLRVL